VLFRFDDHGINTGFLAFKIKRTFRQYTGKKPGILPESVKKCQEKAGK
jgi:hypothetical protein